MPNMKKCDWHKPIVDQDKTKKPDQFFARYFYAVSTFIITLQLNKEEISEFTDLYEW